MQILNNREMAALESKLDSMLDQLPDDLFEVGDEEIAALEEATRLFSEAPFRHCRQARIGQTCGVECGHCNGTGWVKK